MSNVSNMEKKVTAAEWYVRLRSENATAETEAAFLSWLRESADNEADYALCEFSETLVREVQDDAEVRGYVEECRELVSRRRASGTRRLLLRGPWLAAASVLLTVALGAGGYLMNRGQAYETAVGEQRAIVLADGSQVALNTNTSLSVAYSDHRRVIRLLHGEAFFNVARDTARPFEVLAGEGVARAVGTAFGVAMREDEVKVSVIEGTVEVNVPVKSASSGDAIGTQTLTEGTAIKYWSDGAIAQVEEADTHRINAWREGKLAFDHMRLADVVNEHNRYTAQRIVLGSDDIKNLAVSGMFAIGDTESLIFLLEHSLGLKAIRQANVIVLTRPSVSRPAEREDAGSEQARPADDPVPAPARS